MHSLFIVHRCKVHKLVPENAKLFHNTLQYFSAS